MNSRVVRVYDGPVPTVEEVMFCDPALRPPFPDETWSAKMQPTEVALFCVNFKSETPVREETGRSGPQSEETCRIFPTIEDAEAYGRVIVKAHPSTICILRSRDEQELKRVSNRRFLSKFAFASLVGMGIWAAFATGIGLAIIWVVRALAHGPGFQWILSLSAWQWLGVLAVAAVLGMGAILSKTYLSVRKRVDKFNTAIAESLSPEEKARYAEVDALSVSAQLEDRQRARELVKEYSERIGEIRRQMRPKDQSLF